MEVPSFRCWNAEDSVAPIVMFLCGVATVVVPAITLFGTNSGAALATVVGVLVEVPVMLSV
jgi:ACR3 family arsenite efflux pump ArsB